MGNWIFRRKPAPVAGTARQQAGILDDACGTAAEGPASEQQAPRPARRPAPGDDDHFDQNSMLCR
ncbi:hypothetical protein [Amycolatopsis dongchuanensis]|uniref:Uncharacterized protein n=1 Tax=Amycolatopsis dongchuanensis TaxID=1070866 RepID=A0ABP9QTC9_9PSEU